MNPEERKRRNRVWRELWALQERWELHSPKTAAECARELREYLLSRGAPNPPGRPKGH